MKLQHCSKSCFWERCDEAAEVTFQRPRDPRPIRLDVAWSRTEYRLDERQRPLNTAWRRYELLYISSKSRFVKLSTAALASPAAASRSCSKRSAAACMVIANAASQLEATRTFREIRPTAFKMQTGPVR